MGGGKNNDTWLTEIKPKEFPNWAQTGCKKRKFKYRICKRAREAREAWGPPQARTRTQKRRKRKG